ncbi:MAG: 1-acyl-sn-glycerol-3-phosphate acyltransferase [Bacteroidota bacterium]|nr:1-acyl-sn-glycerol-3-phosphate acyltransferase [Bacteroidota bacterium]
MSSIYDYKSSYSLVRRYVLFCFKLFYGEYIVTGRENIPKEGPIIYAANHLNALMDPLAVISVVPIKQPIVYLARADMFKKKAVIKILRFCKILPAFRMRDGIGNLEKNHGIFEQCLDVLEHNKALGIMPEGNQGPYRRLRPLVKGIFRIAFTAQEKYGTQPCIKIVPIGIDMEDLEKFGKHLIINIGKPMEVSDYMTEYNENPVHATNHIRNNLRDELISLTLNLATEKHYDCFETAVEVANTDVVKQLKTPDTTLSRFSARQKIANRLIKMEKRKAKTAEKLDAICSEYKANLVKLNLHSWVFDKKPFNYLRLVATSLLLTVTFPVFIVGFSLNMLPFFLPDVIRKIMKLNLPGGLSSFRFGLGMLTFPVFYILQGILIYKKIQGYLWYLIIIIPAQYFLGKLTFQWYRNYKKLLARFRYHKLKKQKSPILEKTQFLHEQITRLVQAL